MRGFLLQTLDSALSECDFILVGGLTGVGKTELLMQLNNAVDLEGHAHHRGSSFGRNATPQPGQIDFENALARSEEHTSELQSLMRISYAVFCLKTKTNTLLNNYRDSTILQN